MKAVRKIKQLETNWFHFSTFCRPVNTDTKCACKNNQFSALFMSHVDCPLLSIKTLSRYKNENGFLQAHRRRY